MSPLRSLALPLPPPSRPPGRFVRVGGRAVHVVEAGPPNAPVVLLSSGLGGSWLGWDPVLPLLRGHCRLVSLDRPGLGRSAPAPEPPTLAGRARWTAAVLEALGIGGPVTVVGHSLGGLYAEAFARILPRQTSAVVLVEAAAEAEVGPPLRWPGARTRLAHTAGEAFRWAGLSQIVAPGLRRLGVRTQSLRGRDQADVGDAYRSAYGAGHCLTAAMVERALFRDLVAELDALRERFAFPSVPLRVISGPCDDPRPHRALAAFSPCGIHTAVHGTRHLVPVDRPDAIADAVRAVLAPASPAAPVSLTPRT
ncbi:alpha/beta fold hydrolase [Streptomyces sp. NPDC054933]